MFYLRWAEEPRSEKIVSVEVVHREGELPQAEVWLQGEVLGECAALYEDEQCFFKGRVIQWVQEEGLLCLSLLGGALDVDGALEEAIGPLREGPGYDPLFMEGEGMAEVLEGYALLPHWHPVTGALTFSALHRGGQCLDLGAQFFQDSLKLSQSQPPLGGVDLCLRVEWIQRYGGILDCGSLLREAFPGGQVGTLTPQSLIHNWWKGGEKQGPYQVVRSGLESLGEEGYSPSFSVGGEPTQLPISWFDPILLMRWTYAQKRVEEAHMILKQGEGPHKSLHFTLQNVLADHKTPHWCEGSDYGVGDRMQYQGFFYTCTTAHRSRDSLEMDFPHWALSFKNNSALGHMGGSSYFLGQRGTLSLDHGIARAQTHWLMGQRVLRLSFEAPFHAVAGITCDHEVRLEDPRLPEGAIVGKVIGYTLHLTYGDLVARVDLACGAPENMPRVQKGAYAHQKPQGGILEPESLSAEDLVSTLQVENGLEDQKALLEGQEFESMASLWTLLQAHPTRVSIGFKPLAHGAPLSHTIEVPLQS